MHFVVFKGHNFFLLAPVETPGSKGDTRVLRPCWTNDDSVGQGSERLTTSRIPCRPVMMNLTHDLALMKRIKLIKMIKPHNRLGATCCLFNQLNLFPQFNLPMLPWDASAKNRSHCRGHQVCCHLLGPVRNRCPPSFVAPKERSRMGRSITMKERTMKKFKERKKLFHRKERKDS